MENKPDKNLITVTARIHVESDSQKGVLIGQNGRMIKAIGQSARRELERIFETRIFLDLTVRVEKNWSRDTRALRRLGY
jgi:GTP-binding protein Era